MMNSRQSYDLTDILLEQSLIILGEATYFGTRTNSYFDDFDKKYGAGLWRIGWRFGEKVVDRDQAFLLYEEGYRQFLIKNPNVLEWIINTASEVYDFAPSNIESGFDYWKQESDATHLQDIAVRKIVHSMGKKFKGDHLVQIRGHETEGYVLNPGQVPFHMPEMIAPVVCPISPWWKKNSVEDFYQSNKALIVAPERLKVNIAVKGEGKTFFSYDKYIYYLQDASDSKVLWRQKGREVRRLCNEHPELFKHEREHDRRPYSDFITSSI